MDPFSFLLILLLLKDFQQRHPEECLMPATTQNVQALNNENANILSENVNQPRVQLCSNNTHGMTSSNPNIIKKRYQLLYYLNHITYPSIPIQTTFYLNKNTSIQTIKLHKIEHLINYKAGQDPLFHKKMLKTIKYLALCHDTDYESCYKYLFKILLNHPTFKEKDIKTFQQLFEDAHLKRKDIIFSYWFVVTFPNLSIKYFLEYAIAQIKEEVFQKPYLKDFYESNLGYLDLCLSKSPCKPILNQTNPKSIKNILFFSFPFKDKINPNASLILVKIHQYLDSKDKANKEELMSLISHSCFTEPVFVSKNELKNFYQEIKLQNEKITLVFYEFPNNKKIVAFTEASHLKELLNNTPDIIDVLNIKKVYYGNFNFACITFKKPVPFEIQPLTQQDIENLDETYGALILVNPNVYQTTTSYYYSPNFNGGIKISNGNEENGNEDKGYGLKKLLKINKKILKKANEEI